MTTTIPTAESADPVASENSTASESSTASEDRDPIISASVERRRKRRESAAITTLSILAVLYSAYLAQAVVMPVVIALILTILLRPLVRRFRKYHLPDAVSAALILVLLVTSIGVGMGYLVGPAKEWINNAPAHMQVVGEKLRFVRKQIDEIDQASAKMRALAEGEESPEKPERRSSFQETIRQWTGEKDPDQDLAGNKAPIPVEVRQPRITTGLSFITVTGGVLAGVVIILVLTYFLLTTGDRLINNVLRVMPTFREKRNIVEMVHEVEHGVSTYLLTVTLINIGLGVVIGLAMWLLGVPNPALWGAMATVLNFIPYLGAMTGTVIVFLVAVLSFDSMPYAILVPTVYFLCTAIEGNFITPALLGRHMSLSPVFVFLSLIFWGWLWGPGGALIAVPILAILKIALDQFDRTRPLGSLLEA